MSISAEPSSTQRSDQEIGDIIQAIFKRHRRRYGYRQIWQELSDRGVICAADRVRRIMIGRGLKAIQPKTCVPRTSDGRADKPSPNLLVDHPLPDQPDQVWAGDITSIPTSAGWLYLAVVIVAFARSSAGRWQTTCARSLSLTPSNKPLAHAAPLKSQSSRVTAAASMAMLRIGSS